MAPRYVIRTVDEDWIDLFDAPARIEEKRAAWDEAKRRVREHPELKTVVLDRHTGATLWQSGARHRAALPGPRRRRDRVLRAGDRPAPSG